MTPAQLIADHPMLTMLLLQFTACMTKSEHRTTVVDVSSDAHQAMSC